MPFKEFLIIFETIKLQKSIQKAHEFYSWDGCQENKTDIDKTLDQKRSFLKNAVQK